MKEKRRAHGDPANRAPERRSGGAQGRERKGLIRSLYDCGSRLEIRAEKGIVKLAKALAARLRPGGR